MQEALSGKARKDAQWQQRLARFDGGDMPVKEFCQAEAVSQASFHRWRKQLREAGAVAAQVAKFIDVGVLPSPASAAAATQAAEPQLEVRLELGPGLVLHIVRR
jgi:transposase-like protein